MATSTSVCVMMARSTTASTRSITLVCSAIESDAVSRIIGWSRISNVIRLAQAQTTPNSQRPTPNAQANSRSGPREFVGNWELRSWELASSERLPDAEVERAARLEVAADDPAVHLEAEVEPDRAERGVVADAEAVGAAQFAEVEIADAVENVAAIDEERRA